MNQILVKPSPNWESLIEDWSKSGLTQRDFCRKRGISHANFMKERGRLIKLGIGPKSARVPATGISGQADFVGFIPVTVEPPPATAALPEIVVELPMGVVIRFRGVQQ